jgi:hypothetical protein
MTINGWRWHWVEAWQRGRRAEPDPAWRPHTGNLLQLAARRGHVPERGLAGPAEQQRLRPARSRAKRRTLHRQGQLDQARRQLRTDR